MNGHVASERTWLRWFEQGGGVEPGAGSSIAGFHPRPRKVKGGRCGLVLLDKRLSCVDGRQFLVLLQDRLRNLPGSASRGELTVTGTHVWFLFAYSHEPNVLQSTPTHTSSVSIRAEYPLRTASSAPPITLQFSQPALL